jgi:hypothetical protein
MFGIDNERAGVEEQYQVAGNTSNLTVEADRRGSADFLIAAGLIKNRMASALVHLEGAWAKADKPAKRSAAWIATRAAEYPDKKGRPDIRRATIEAMVLHAKEMRNLAARLPGRNTVLGLLEEWATMYGIENDLLSPAIFHWLAPACPACEGRGKHRMPDAPTLSKRTCNHCAGTGTWPRPLGADRVHNYLKSCVGKAKGDMVSLLYRG